MESAGSSWTADGASHRPSQGGLSPAEAAVCLDAVHAAAAVLAPDNSVSWANRRWQNLMGNSFASANAAARPDRARATEQESLLARVRQNGRGVEYRDTVHGEAINTTMLPLEAGRVLVVLNPVAAAAEQAPPAPRQTVDHLELKHPSLGPLDRLSRREREVLALLASGLTIKRIAEKLARSEKTIEGHRDSIYRKVGVSSRAELAILAIRAGLLSADKPAGEAQPATTGAQR